MRSRTIGVLHPGAMGASVVAALVTGGHRVLWASDGRSAATQERARAAGAQGCPSLDELTQSCESIISVCPPDAADELALAVAQTGFVGTYLDANAISPARSAGLAERFGNQYVDGGIVGPPALVTGTTRFFLSGTRAQEMAELFAGSFFEPVVLAEGGAAASALKMCYAAWTKGNSALLLSVRALAERYGVGAALESEWERSQPGLLQRAEGAARAVAPKAWRFSGEMHEIAETYEHGGLPRGFHDGAAAFYAELATFKNAQGVSLADVLRQLQRTDTQV